MVSQEKEMSGGLMKFNSGGDRKPLKGLTKDRIIEGLFSLLDDIDTAGDMFKPEITPFFKYVIRKSKERFKYASSDGYKITDKGE